MFVSLCVLCMSVAICQGLASVDVDVHVTLTQQMANIEAVNHNLETEMAALKKTVSHLENNQCNCTELADNQEDINDYLTEKLDKLSANLESMNNTLKSHTVSIENLINSAPGSVAFLAVMHDDYEYRNNDSLEFNTTLLNLGSHYSPYTSVFTCPKRGIYFFSFSIHVGCTVGGVDLMLNNTVIISTKSKNDGNECIYVQMASTAVVECPQWGRVWLHSHASSSELYGSPSDPSTVFMGFVLHYL